jgi:hypothetical protein
MIFATEISQLFDVFINFHKEVAMSILVLILFRYQHLLNQKHHYF